MSWLLNDMIGLQRSSPYYGSPVLTGSSPILINQVNSTLPNYIRYGYECEGCIVLNFGSDDMQRKDISNAIEDVITNTQKYNNRFTYIPELHDL